MKDKEIDRLKTKEELSTWVGKRVEKYSGKPFKSTFKKNTVKEVIQHPKSPHRLAFTFVEDESYVSATMCKLVNE